jgi:hypothetical protein
MGYIPSATTTTLLAKLTPVGRKKLILTDNNLISSFSIGDSDANYFAALPLGTGQVPGDGGTLGANSTVSNSVGSNVGIKSFLVVNSMGQTKKPTEVQSSGVTIDFIANGQTTISGASLSQNVITRTNTQTDPLVNLYYAFNLPLNTTDDFNYTGLTPSFGGFSGTALSGIAQTKIIAIGIGGSIGELIDGKQIKLSITTTASTFNIYSTFQNTGLPLSVQDANYTDAAANTRMFGSNVAFLVSDDIKKPNGGNAALSWSTGFGSVKPFSVNAKQLYNLTTDTNLAESADTVVGIAYLDKGFLVITEPTIVNNFNPASTATSVTLNSVSSSVVQNVTCLLARGEFGVSSNPTFRNGDTPRISEIGLYDGDGDLIALAKMDRQIVRNVNEFLALGIRIGL